MSQTKATISIAIATFNEEKNILRCLDALKEWVDEIVIVDGESSDNTVKIAKQYSHVKIISTTNKPIFHINKQIAIDACTSDWILQLDADEVVTPQLKKEIMDILSRQPNDIKDNGFWIKRKNYFLGRFLKKGGQYPDPTIRFYKNGKGKLPCKDVHEQAVVDGSVGCLNNDLEHFADPTFSRYLTRYNRYTSLLAQELYDQKIPLNTLSFVNYFMIKPKVWFFMAYFRHKGFMDGFPGFVFALFSSLRFQVAYIKYWELSKTNRHINTTDDWDT